MLSKEEATEIARRHALEHKDAHTYIGDGTSFQPHEWVVEAVQEASQNSAFTDTAGWFVRAGQQPFEPKPDPKQVCFYLGMQMEELAEKMGLVLGDDAVVELDSIAKTFKAQAPELVFHIASVMKEQPNKWLDADMDLLWVTIGAARAMGSDPQAAYRIVAEANWAKFKDGVVKDVNGKVVKPAGWKEPDLTPAIHAALKEKGGVQ